MKKILIPAALIIVFLILYFFIIKAPITDKDKNLTSTPQTQSIEKTSSIDKAKEKTDEPKPSISKPVEVSLKIGDAGDKVKELQVKLNKFNYNLDADGQFGELTLFAIQNFQAKVKITSNGIADSETLKLLDSTPAKDPYIYKPPMNKNKPLPSSNSSDTYETFINSQNCASETDYYIYTNLSKHIVCIFTGSTGNWKLIKSFSCSSGAPSSPTIKGHFTVGDKGTYFVTENNLICKYFTQFSGNYLFHSILYDRDGDIVDSRLGVSISHGCIRLALDNAKYIYDNVPVSTSVWIQ